MAFTYCQKYGNENWKGKLRVRRGWALHNYDHDYRQTCRYIYIKLTLEIINTYKILNLEKLPLIVSSFGCVMLWACCKFMLLPKMSEICGGKVDKILLKPFCLKMQDFCEKLYILFPLDISCNVLWWGCTLKLYQLSAMILSRSSPHLWAAISIQLLLLHVCS